ncbi:MAG: hypothetical protein JWL77_6543 [Chthonomonadaceae bacterium]|nr:hypothetical protein [Chthonomonadaceae bacterium]
MTSQPIKPKRKRWVRNCLAAALLLLLLGGEVARRALHGHGHVHELAVNLYHRFKEARREQARAALGLPERADEPLKIYDNVFLNDWVDWSWAKHNSASTDHALPGRHAIAMTPTAFQGVYLHHTPLGTSGYGTLQCYIFGTSTLTVGMVDGGGAFGKQIPLERYRLPAPERPAGWSVVRIPLTDLGLSRLGDMISGFVFQSATAATQPDLLLDDISLLPDPSLPAAPTEATVAIAIDADADRHPISPYIYGTAFAAPDILADLHPTVNRWGGNDKTRYNWVHGNATNAARDWRWANRYGAGDVAIQGPSSAADTFFMRNHSANAATLLTVPTIGWVAKDTDNGNTSLNVPSAGGPPLTTSDGAIAGYDPTENRKHTSVPSFARNPSPSANVPPAPSPIYQDDWIRHLVNSFGKASQGGVQFYSMDNELDLWDSTHTDVHPAQMGYDAMLANFLEYATAVKTVDPSAQVTGPVTSGWTSLLYSSLDRGADNFHTHADCTRHGGEAFTLWFLKQVQAHDLRTHTRSLDVLDVHYYPQGASLFTGGTDQDAKARRLRATRSLWDPEYSDESWIGEPVRLIPRLREWIASGYPGTKIGITEWNFGADQDINGALTIADVLGIYGREDVYLANYWACPAKNSAGYLAFRLYRNADGNAHGFGDMACQSKSADANKVSCYTAIDSKTGDLTLMLINKMRRATVTTPITIKGKQVEGGLPKMWSLSSAHPTAILPQTGPSVHASAATLTLPPSSITLVRFSAGPHL